MKAFSSPKNTILLITVILTLSVSAAMGSGTQQQFNVDAIPVYELKSVKYWDDVLPTVLDEGIEFELLESVLLKVRKNWQADPLLEKILVDILGNDLAVESIELAVEEVKLDSSLRDIMIDVYTKLGSGTY